MKKVYEYIKEHSLLQTKEISDGLQMKEIEVLNCINILQKKGYVEVVPAPLSSNVNNSCFYRVTGKRYEEH